VVVARHFLGKNGRQRIDRKKMYGNRQLRSSKKTRRGEADAPR
jgi:hypothetical protein